MASYYTVVRYVPDPVREECINIGVLVFGDGRVRAQFLDNWTRVRCFAGRRVDFLRAFADEVAEAVAIQPALPGIVGAPYLDDAALRGMVTNWHNSIQFTRPRASLATPDALLEEIAETYLVEPRRRRRHYRDRRVVLGIATRHLEAALNRRREQLAQEILKRGWEVEGELDRHHVDLAVAKERVYMAADALSFENPDESELRESIQAMAFAMNDLRRRNPQLPLAVAVLLPLDGSSNLHRAERYFRMARVDLVTEEKIPDWATAAARELPAAALRPQLLA